MAKPTAAQQVARDKESARTIWLLAKSGNRLAKKALKAESREISKGGKK